MKHPSAEFYFLSEVSVPQQNFISSIKGFIPHIWSIILVSLSTRMYVVLSIDYSLPWSSLAEFTIYFCNSSRCLRPVSTGYSIITPHGVPSLQGFLVNGSLYLLFYSRFCNLFLQVLSDSNFLVVGFSFGNSLVKRLNVHHYIASPKMPSISIIWSLTLHKKIRTCIKA